MTSAMESAQVTANLAGVNELKLLVDDGGNGTNSDHAYTVKITLELSCMDAERAEQEML